MVNIDLHTHSSLSADGGLRADDYRRMLSNGPLNYVAITDHNSVSFAQEMQAELGDKIIVGEEIMTNQGEIIGLYLSGLVPSGLDLIDTVNLIKSQGGLVYAPHPFEKVRSGLSLTDLNKIVDKLDIIEVINGRALSAKHRSQAHRFAAQHDIAPCASSDAHGWHGWGRTYTALSKKPNKQNLSSLLSSAKLIYKKPSARAVLYPKYNKLRKVL